MKKRRAFGPSLFLAMLVFGGMASAQTGLPPEARARVIIIQIDSALAAKPANEVLALQKLRELDSVGAARPAALYVTEAKLAGRAKDYVRARGALEKYFKAATSSDAAYNEAAQIYAALEPLEAQQKVQDEAAFTAAAAVHTCASYRTYLSNTGSPLAKAELAAAAYGELSCPQFDHRGLPMAAQVAFVKVENTRWAAAAAAQGASFEQAARSLLAGRWYQVEGFLGPTPQNSLSCAVLFEQFEVRDGAVLRGTPYYLRGVQGSTIVTSFAQGNEATFAVERDAITVRYSGNSVRQRDDRYVRCR